MVGMGRPPGLTPPGYFMTPLRGWLSGSALAFAVGAHAFESSPEILRPLLAPDGLQDEPLSLAADSDLLDLRREPELFRQPDGLTVAALEDFRRFPPAEYRPVYTYYELCSENPGKAFSALPGAQASSILSGCSRGRRRQSRTGSSPPG